MKGKRTAYNELSTDSEEFTQLKKEQSLVAVKAQDEALICV